MTINDLVINEKPLSAFLLRSPVGSKFWDVMAAKANGKIIGFGEISVLEGHYKGELSYYIISADVKDSQGNIYGHYSVQVSDKLQPMCIQGTDPDHINPETCGPWTYWFNPL